jgi:hypothetical protein
MKRMLPLLRTLLLSVCCLGASSLAQAWRRPPVIE